MLPTQYAWLEREDGPRMLVEAIKLCGIAEDLDEGEDNPTILAWADEVGGKVDDVYKADSIPWCGLFMAVVAKRAGKQLPVDPLWALNWGTFGKAAEPPMLGDVLVFVRRTEDGKRAGHVGLYVGEDDEAYHVLGGNQSDCVCVARIEKARRYAARRPRYNRQPDNIRPIRLAGDGALSDNEG